jgi:hypothetical protein
MSQSDEDAIRALEHRFNAACDAHDPDGLAEPLIDDAQFINVNGAWTIWALADRRDAEHRRPPKPAALAPPRHHS